MANRSVLELLAEATRLRASPRRLGLTEYIDFQLFRGDVPWELKREFGGVRAQIAAQEMLVDDYSRFLSLDKVTMYVILKGFGFPVPRVRAIYRSCRPSSQLRLESDEALLAYLQEAGNLPVYIKPAYGGFGRGNVLVSGFDGTHLSLGNGTRQTPIDFARLLDDPHPLGWMLQEPLTSHYAITQLTGSPKISGLRIHTVFKRHASAIHKVIWKINAGERDFDNFHNGRSGNMLAAVDPQTGVVIRAISGVGLKQSEITVHPKTGSTLLGFQIPFWPEVVNLVNDAQRAFPGFICPGWDIALCDDGPKILEVNAFGDVDLAQYAYRRSFFEGELMQALQERGLAHLLDHARGRRTRSPVNHRLGIRRHHWPW